MPARATRFPRLSNVVLAGSIAVLAAECSSGTPIPTGPSATAAPTSAGTAAPAAGPVELCNTTPGVGCQFNAGDFRSTHFTGGFTIHVIGDNTWTNKANAPVVVILEIGGDGGFGATGDPSSVVFVHGAPRLASGSGFEAVSDGEQAKTALGAVTGLTVKTVAGPVIDGQGGVTFRVSNTSAKSIVLWQYPTTTAAGTYDLPAGASTEVHWLTIGGVPVIVAFLSPGNGLDGFMLDADPMIRSIHFG
jgi:hypothetical protein